MKGFLLIAVVLAYHTAFAESQERKPATRTAIGLALSTGLEENEKLRQQLEDRSDEPPRVDEKPKIFVELGDGR